MVLTLVIQINKQAKLRCLYGQKSGLITGEIKSLWKGKLKRSINCFLMQNSSINSLSFSISILGEKYTQFLSYFWPKNELKFQMYLLK